MQLSIYTIEKTLFNGKIKSLRCKTPSGEITVLDYHIPLITVINPGPIFYSINDSKDQELWLKGGILEVQPNNKVVILANS